MPTSIREGKPRDMDLFSAEGFIPRAYCGNWGNWQYLNQVAQVGIGLSYIMIPLILLVFGCKKSLGLRNRWAFVLLFGTFITLCGMGHMLDALMFEWPAYKLLTLWHCATCVSSAFTAVVLSKLLLAYLERAR